MTRTLATDDSDVSSGKVEDGREEVDERIVRGAIDRRRRQADQHGALASAGQLSLLRARDYMNIDYHGLSSALRLRASRSGVTAFALRTPAKPKRVGSAQTREGWTSVIR
jgi:hypothetical protein